MTFINFSVNVASVLVPVWSIEILIKIHQKFLAFTELMFNNQATADAEENLDNVKRRTPHNIKYILLLGISTWAYFQKI